MSRLAMLGSEALPDSGRVRPSHGMRSREAAGWRESHKDGPFPGVRADFRFRVINSQCSWMLPLCIYCTYCARGFSGGRAYYRTSTSWARCVCVCLDALDSEPTFPVEIGMAQACFVYGLWRRHPAPPGFVSIDRQGS